MSEHVEAQQAAAEELGTVGISTTLMVHYPSKIKAPKGVLLTPTISSSPSLQSMKLRPTLSLRSEQLRV